MIPYRNDMMLSSEQVDAIRTLAESEARIEVLYLFGSRANGKASETSDYDFAIRLSSPLSLTEQAELNTKLMKISRSSRVDTVFLNEAPILLKFEAINGGQALFSRLGADALNRYEMSIYREYFHTERFRRLQREQLKEDFGV